MIRRNAFISIVKMMPFYVVFQFYGDFTLLLEKFLQKVKEFCSERNREKDDLVREMPSVPTQGPAIVGYHPQAVCKFNF